MLSFANMPQWPIGRITWTGCQNHRKVLALVHRFAPLPLRCACCPAAAAGCVATRPLVLFSSDRIAFQMRPAVCSSSLISQGASAGVSKQGQPQGAQHTLALACML